MAGDIKKMYNTVKLSEDDMHTHRFLWKNFDLEIQKESHRFNTFVGNRVTEIQSKTEPIEWY